MKPQTARIVCDVLDSFDSHLGPFYKALNYENRMFVKKQISHLPRYIQQVLIERYGKGSNQFESNTGLRLYVERLNRVLSTRDNLHLDSNHEQIHKLAERLSLRCKRIEQRSSSIVLPPPVNRNQNAVNGQCSVNGNDNTIYELSTEVVNGYGLNAPKLSKSLTVNGAIKRMQNTDWWARNLVKYYIRKKEEVAIHLGLVNSKKNKYCSKATFKNRIYKKAAQRASLDNIIMINELGESFSLGEIYEKNVSNPVNRRNELMTRLSGFETLAKELEHSAVFVTFTCPSRYHNSYSKSGDVNPKWDGSTPYDGQQYLNVVWQRIRAELARQGIQLYGFRISEPQHDGTPHWHFVLFVEPSHLGAFKKVATNYCLAEDGAEKGAEQHRVTFKDIDPSKGSATGYIAKYISKNIDGGNLDSDIDGGCASEAAKRVEAWASCWGIRQFQQIGCASVTVWRELRRMVISKDV